MKKITLFIAALSMITTGMAQVHVINDAFIYSKGTDIFITDKLELKTAPVVDPVTPSNNRPGSAFYLRNEAQVIQKNNVANTGEGVFSVFQEGAANNFTYNYWSSPVSQPGATVANAGFKNNQIYFPTLMEKFEFETDLVIDAQQANLLATSVRDGLTDQQEFTDNVNKTGPTIISRPLSIATRWLYSYNSVGAGAGGGGGYFGWRGFQTATETVGAGYGFTMKGVKIESGVNIETSPSDFKGQRYDFRGIPNNGDITVGVKSDDFSLVGNPYPSALDLKKFMEDVANRGKIDGELFFWDSESTTHTLIDYIGGYGTYVPDVDQPGEGMYVDAAFTTYTNSGIPTGVSAGSGTVTAPPGITPTRRYAPVGQGFVIQRSVDDPSTTTITEGDFPDDGSNGFVTFKNSHRVFKKEDTENSIFKAAPAAGNDQTVNSQAKYIRPKMRITAFINKLYNRNMILAFGDDATLGWDWGKDGSNNANRVATDVYMPVEGRQAIIQTMPNITEETTIPLAFKSAVDNATFELRIYQFENFDTANVLIHDKENNTYHDILNDSYTIKTGKGEVKERYEIVFQEKTTLSTGEVAVKEGFNIFQNNPQNLLTVRNNNMKDVSNISIYDLAGRQVTTLNPKDVSADYTFNTSAYATGIYIVKVTTTDDAVAAQKVVVSN